MRLKFNMKKACIGEGNKHDIEEITFTIPYEKVVCGRATLQFLDKNNGEAVAYEMPLQIELVLELQEMLNEK